MRPSDSPRLRLASLILATAGCLVAPFTFQVTVNPNETEVIRGQTFEISVTVAVEGITFNEADLRFVGEVPGPSLSSPLTPVASCVRRTRSLIWAATKGSSL